MNELELKKSIVVVRVSIFSLFKLFFFYLDSTKNNI